MEVLNKITATPCCVLFELVVVYEEIYFLNVEEVTSVANPSLKISSNVMTVCRYTTNFSCNGISNASKYKKLRTIIILKLRVRGKNKSTVVVDTSLV